MNFDQIALRYSRKMLDDSLTLLALVHEESTRDRWLLVADICDDYFLKLSTGSHCYTTIWEFLNRIPVEYRDWISYSKEENGLTINLEFGEYPELTIKIDKKSSAARKRLLELGVQEWQIKKMKEC